MMRTSAEFWKTRINKLAYFRKERLEEVEVMVMRENMEEEQEEGRGEVDDSRFSLDRRLRVEEGKWKK